MHRRIEKLVKGHAEARAKGIKKTPTLFVDDKTYNLRPSDLSSSSKVVNKQ